MTSTRGSEFALDLHLGADDLATKVAVQDSTGKAHDLSQSALGIEPEDFKAFVTDLQDLHLLSAKKEEIRDGVGEFDLIRAPILGITKKAAAWLGGVGLTASAALAGVGAWWADLEGAAQTTVIVSAAVALVVLMLSVVAIVVADMHTRRDLTALRIATRARLTNSVFELRKSR